MHLVPIAAPTHKFSDHVFERRSDLNFVASKLRRCSLGPELEIDATFNERPCQAGNLRNEKALWEEQKRAGELKMGHSIANPEHHRFEFSARHQAGFGHVRFMGADCQSLSEGIGLGPGDAAEVRFQNFGRGPCASRSRQRTARQCRCGSG